MITLDDNLLNDIGLAALPATEKDAFKKHMYETLEMRVGTRLAERMSEQQMVEFEQFINTGDEQGAFHWLETNFPNYKQVVAEEFEKLKSEIAPLAPQILAASQEQARAAHVQAPQSPAIEAPPHHAAEPLPPQSPHHGNHHQVDPRQHQAAPAPQQAQPPQPQYSEPAPQPQPAQPREPLYGQSPNYPAQQPQAAQPQPQSSAPPAHDQHGSYGPASNPGQQPPQ